MRRALHLGQVELGLEDRPDAGEHHGHVVGQASGHDGVGRNLADRGRASARTHGAEVEVGIEARSQHHALDSLWCGDDDRQAVGAVVGVQIVERGRFVCCVEQCRHAAEPF